MDLMDIRPDWVKEVLSLRPHLLGYPQKDGSWSFKPSPPINSPDWPVGEIIFFCVKPSGRQRPSIWDGNRWLDLRDQDGRELHRQLFEQRKWHL